MQKYTNTFGACPSCGKGLTYGGRERHPSRADLELRNFLCETCGPVKTEIALRPPWALVAAFN